MSWSSQPECQATGSSGIGQLKPPPLRSPRSDTTLALRQAILMVQCVIELGHRMNIEYAENGDYGLIGREMLNGGLWTL